MRGVHTLTRLRASPSGTLSRSAGEGLFAHEIEPPMTHLLDYLADRVLLCDGAMGTQVQAPQPRYRARFPRPRKLHRDPVREPPRSGPRNPPRLSQRRRRRGPDQQLWRLADHARRVRHRRQGLRAQQARRRTGARGGRRIRRMTAAPASSSARSGRARGCRRSAISPTRTSKTRWRSNAPGWSPARSMRS